jgi:uncharacterized membrane protein YqjE
MASFDRRPSPVPPRDALARLIDGVQTLFREHLALAKAELKDDVRRAGRSVLLSAAGLPPLFVGYVLLMVAIALLLQLVLVAWAAFGIVALLNLIVGAALTAAFGAKVRAEKLALVRTQQELRRDKEWLSSMRGANGGVGAMEGPRTRATTRESTEMATAATERGSTSRTRSPQLPSGKAGATADLQARTPSPTPGQPVAGATSTPNGEPMTAERDEPVRH